MKDGEADWADKGTACDKVVVRQPEEYLLCCCNVYGGDAGMGMGACDHCSMQ